MQAFRLTVPEYPIPFAIGEKRFPYEQITEFRPSALHPVLRRAAAGWSEPRYRALARQSAAGRGGWN